MQVGEPIRPAIVLTGWRRALRRAAVWLVVLTAAMIGLAALLAVEDAPLGPLVTVWTIWLTWRAAATLGDGFPAGRRTGVRCLVLGPLACVLLLASLHGPTSSSALPAALIGAAALLPLGLLLFVVDTITYNAELARLRRASAPAIPTARVVRR